MDPEAASVFQRQLAAAKQGSESALGELAESVRPDLAAFMRRGVGPGLRRKMSVSDLEQDVLMGIGDIVQRLPEDAGPEDLRALVLRHAHWAIGKGARRGAREHGESALGMPDQVFDAAVSTPSSGPVTSADEAERITGLIRELPAELASVVQLRIQELTFPQIGERLGIGEDAARKRFLRAARRLRKLRDG